MTCLLLSLARGLGLDKAGINGQAASGAAGEFGLPPLLTAMFSDFLGGEDALPFQTGATEVDEQGDSRVAAGEIIYDLGDFIIRERMGVRLDFNKNSVFNQIVRLVHDNSYAIFIDYSDGEMFNELQINLGHLQGEISLIRALSMSRPEVIVRRHRCADDLVGNILIRRTFDQLR